MTNLTKLEETYLLYRKKTDMANHHKQIMKDLGIK